MKYILKYKEKETTISVDQFNELMSGINAYDIVNVCVEGNKTTVKTLAGIVYFNNLTKEKELVKELVDLYKKVAKTYGLSYDDVWEWILVDELKGDDE